MIQRAVSAAESRTHRHPDGPVRMCIGCGRRELAVKLVRVATVRDGNGNRAVVVDNVGNLAGRGAWLHRAPHCLQLAVRRRAFAHALRITGSPDLAGVEEQINCTAAPDERRREIR